jgi:heme A synthase
VILKASQRLANALGGMLLIQVVLGGAAVLINNSYITPHIIWGILTFAVLIALTVVSARELGTKSIIFRLSIAVIVDFIVQVLLGFLSLAALGGSLTFITPGSFVLIHLTNAFILAILATTLIAYNRAIASVAPTGQPPVAK